MRRVIKVQRGLEVSGRALLFAGFFPPAWLAGTAALSLSKILDNMEIGHNVMHGQFDWTNDPKLSSKGFEWDTACPGDQWRHSHNYMHHTHTNIVGKDRDIGYGVLRMSEDQPWRPYYLGNPLWARCWRPSSSTGWRCTTWRSSGSRPAIPPSRKRASCSKGIWRKVRRQTLKDYVLFPALSGPGLPVHACRQCDRQRRPQPVGVHDHLLRSLPRRDAGILRGGDGGRDPRRVVLPPDPRVGEPRGGQAVPHPLRQPEPPDRAPPLPGPAREPLRRDLDRGARDLRALRNPLQLRPAPQAVRKRGPQDLPAGAAGPQVGTPLGAGQGAADRRGIPRDGSADRPSGSADFAVRSSPAEPAARCT